MAPQKKSNYRWTITIYFYLVSGVIIFLMFYTLVLQSKSEKYADVKRRVLKQREVSATRGTIYASDGYPLAKTVTRFDLAIDPSLWRAQDYESGKVASLADSLQSVFFKKLGITSREYLKMFKSGSQYVPVCKNVSMEMFRRIEKFPILQRKNRYLSGFIKKQKQYRLYPLGLSGRRTIGSVKDSSGLEGVYNDILSGNSGVSNRQLIIKKTKRGYLSLWKGIDQDLADVEHGSDITVSIDTYVQRMTHDVLQKYLARHKARYGVAIVMETQTGNVLAMSNLVSNASRTAFHDRMNYAVGWRALEPGSIFKIFSAICLLETGKVDTNTTINTSPGYWKIHGVTIRDDGKKSLGRVSFKTAFEKSSNVAFSKWVQRYFGKNPYEYIDRLYQMGIGNKAYAVSEFPGRLSSYLPHPKSEKWSKISLAYTSFGYEVLMTPLEIITFGNAIANGGVVVKPKFLIKSGGPSEKNIPELATERLGVICSKKNLKKIQKMMEGVVLRGTAKNLRDAPVRIAGKTSTTQIDLGWLAKGNHGGAFLGYFPVENPKYTVYVYVDDPKRKSYYGAGASASAVKEVSKYLAHRCLDHMVPKEI